MAYDGSHLTDTYRVERYPVVVGLINNMPDAAFRATERQFRELLSVAPLDHSIRIRRFYLPEIPRSDEMRSYLVRHYEDIADLWDSPVDGLIVTGAEPRAALLRQEPFWPSFARLIEWAAGNTVSAVWSCLAAHAAVLQMDGIDRRPLNKKLSGIFDCQKIADHPILAGMPASWCIPHSRYNGLPEKILQESGYLLLSRSDEAGADLFVKQGASLFIFLHGHPEYAPDALLREYRRDVTRFLSGEREEFPEPPGFYFDNDTEFALAAFRRKAVEQRATELLADLPTTIAGHVLMHPWRRLARDLFSNWLYYLVAQRSRSSDFNNLTSSMLGSWTSGPGSGEIPPRPHQHIDFAPGP